MTDRARSPVVQTPRWALREGRGAWGLRAVPEEVAVAFTYDRATYAVMMATPADLEDFATGFSLSETVIRDPAEIAGLEIVETELGIDLRMDLEQRPADRLSERRRHLAGPAGCGLCGIESLEQAMRPAPAVAASLRVDDATIHAALAALADAQAINRSTRAVHAAGFYRPGVGLVALREDVGRHNALDKLGGALARQGQSPAEGIVVISSRVSVEMVQKTAVMGAAVLVAVSAPTALAIRTAEAAGITLVAVARDDGYEVFTRAERIEPDPRAHVA